jgi:transposase
VLILDNTKSHYSKDLKAICAEAGVRLEYLLAYSPNYNKIKESFSALKAWMRRNQALVPVFEPFFKGYMHLAMLITYNAQTARGYFK